MIHLNPVVSLYATISILQLIVSFVIKPQMYKYCYTHYTYIMCINLDIVVELIVVLIFIAKHINFEPIWIAINGTHVIVSSFTSFMIWQYSVPKSLSASILNSKSLIYMTKLINSKYVQI
jgi:hypothetical protein